MYINTEDAFNLRHVLFSHLQQMFLFHYENNVVTQSSAAEVWTIQTKNTQTVSMCDNGTKPPIFNHGSAKSCQ